MSDLHEWARRNGFEVVELPDRYELRPARARGAVTPKTRVRPEKLIEAPAAPAASVDSPPPKRTVTRQPMGMGVCHSCKETAPVFQSGRSIRCRDCLNP